ncbi:MAG: M1 family peptidase, partial [Gillisia sp.]|nr:M1 family peptidase [Gillisia sp.]
MRNFKSAMLVFLLILSAGIYAQEGEIPKEEIKEMGHTNQNKFRQLYDEFSTPNQYRTGSGAPGEAYYQNQADYKMDIELNDKNQKLTGVETITYHNNSPDDLGYLWLQLDQNIRSKNSPALQKDGTGIAPVSKPGKFVNEFMEEPFDGGFNIEEVSKDGKPLPYTINFTMMRVDLPQPLKAGESYSFSVKWWYKVNNHVVNRARSGFEHFPEDGNNTYEIAQFFPRMAVYNDVEGWQNMQFWGNGEFALPFGNYEVNITVPADHILDGTGEIQNRKEVYSKEMM